MNRPGKQSPHPKGRLHRLRDGLQFWSFPRFPPKGGFTAAGPESTEQVLEVAQSWVCHALSNHVERKGTYLTMWSGKTLKVRAKTFQLMVV